ncbi:MAG TPA: flap endonuclease-1 [Methanoregulaceae archaeon]|nr:flap endonuclease-1 [Methanoregulaceae archaeon]
MGVALRDILTDYKIPAPWESLGGIAAIDAHNALYQFLSIIRQPDGTPLMDSRGRVTSHLSGILFRSVNFLERGIRPVFVFDGKPPDFKEETIEQRRAVRKEADERWRDALERGDVQEAYKQARSASKIDDEVIKTSKALLSLMGMPYVEAPSEGEAQAAYMVESGDARYGVSQDYDTLLFGAPTLVRNLTVSGKRRMRGRTITVSPEKIMLSDVLKGLAVTREQLIRIGILVGTDFNPGVRGIGAKTALKIIHRGEFDQVVREKLPDLDTDRILDFFQNPPVTDDYILKWDPPDRDGILSMLCDQFEFSPDRVKKSLDGLTVSGGQKTLDSWF